MTDLRTLLSGNMKYLRKELGFSQKKLAQLSGTTPNYIAAIESARRFPGLAVLERIALALKVDTPELLSPPKCLTPPCWESALLEDINKAVRDAIRKRLNIHDN